MMLGGDVHLEIAAVEGLPYVVARLAPRVAGGQAWPGAGPCLPACLPASPRRADGHAGRLVPPTAAPWPYIGTDPPWRPLAGARIPRAAAAGSPGLPRHGGAASRGHPAGRVPPPGASAAAVGRPPLPRAPAGAGSRLAGMARPRAPSDSHILPWGGPWRLLASVGAAAAARTASGSSSGRRRPSAKETVAEAFTQPRGG